MNPHPLLDRFSTHLKNVVAKAMTLATSMEQTEVTSVHLLLAILEEEGSVGKEILQKTAIDQNVIYRFLDNKPKTPIKTENKTATAVIPSLDSTSKKALEKAMLLAYQHEHNYVGTEHLLLGIIQNNDLETEALLNHYKINKEDLINQLESALQSTSKFPNLNEVSEVMDQMQDLISGDSPNASIPNSPNSTGNPKNKKQGLNAIQVFTTDLTDKKLQKNIDPIIGREKEIERLINILCRRHKNNPVLVGEPGVGKTAIIEGLAKKISEGQVPDVLKRKKILSLDMTLLLAGTIYRGEFEARLKQIIDEITRSPDIILFIDELHNIIGAGSSQGAMDAANILKPALARGLLHCIGATTIDEYKKHIAADPALERRFQSIQIEEPSKDETLKILKGLKKYYEDFHHTSITDSALLAAVNLSDKYIHDNFLPDKAIDLIDEACASVKVKQPKNPQESKVLKLTTKIEELQNQKETAITQEKFEVALKLKGQIKKLQKKLLAQEKQLKKNITIPPQKVEAKDIAHILENKLNIKAEVILADGWEELNALPEKLKQSIIGQDEIIETITKNLKQAQLGLKPSHKPLASFLFVGPSGTGKTELSKVLAKELFHSDKALIKLDMGEFTEQHGVSKLLGSPAGYIGYRDRNRFLDEIRERPYSVILFDEFDKAHKDVNKLLLQILDEGTITDSSGKKTYFNHAIIILTSNLGSEYFKSAGIGFDHTPKHSSTLALEHYDNKQVNDKIISKLKEEFGTALLGRLNNICVFNPLSREDVEKIVANKIAELNLELQKTKKISIKPSAEVLSSLAKESYNEEMGARNVEHLVEDILENLVIEILKNKQTKNNYQLIKQVEGYKLK